MTFHQAINWVWKLPYGRNSVRSDYMLVPSEQRGVCSTKHAFIAKLAAEQGVDLKLMTGIFFMDSFNTPKISAVLSQFELPGIPEAHCYLLGGSKRYDITAFDEQDQSFVVKVDLLYEEEIAPEQIGDYKIDLHQKWMVEWLSQNSELKTNFENLWQIRESCIRKLSEQ